MQTTHGNSPFNQKKFPLVLVCDAIQSPANIGSIFRLADSFGIEKIYFCGVAPNFKSKRMERTARSTQHYVPYAYAANSSEILTQLSAANYKLIALEITEKSKPLSTYKCKANEKIALIIGDEKEGISENILQCVSASFHIPMYGKNSSMNVAIAAGIALYEITKQLDSETD